MKADQLSQSAAFIAIKFYGLTRAKQFRTLFDHSVIGFYENTVRSLPAPLRYYHYWLRYRSIRSLYITFEELFLPGDLMHILARKWYIGQMVEELVSDGYEQILILGAGFDHLGLRYARQGLSSLELDAPHMVQLKRQILEQNYPKDSHPDILPLMLPDYPFAKCLQQQQSLSAEKKTIVIVEGFFDYLEKDAVKKILTTIRNHFISPALVGTHFALDELRPFHRFIFRSSLWLVDEKPKFGVSMKEFEHIIHSCGFRIEKKLSPQKFSRDLLTSINADFPVLKGFYLFSSR